MPDTDTKQTSAPATPPYAGLMEKIRELAKRFACWAYPIETEAGHQAQFIKNAEEVMLAVIQPVMAQQEEELAMQRFLRASEKRAKIERGDMWVEAEERATKAEAELKHWKAVALTNDETSAILNELRAEGQKHDDTFDYNRFMDLCGKIGSGLLALRGQLAAAEKDAVKYRTALNRIAHPNDFGGSGYSPKEIARRALVLGVDVPPLPETKEGDYDDLRTQLADAVEGKRVAEEERDELRKVSDIQKSPDLVPISEDPDFGGNTQFRAWFESIWPKPKSRQQKSNWKYKQDMAHAGWVKCEQLANHTITTLRATNAKLAELLDECRHELRLCQVKDGAGPYDPTLKARIDSAIAAATAPLPPTVGLQLDGREGQ